ncbi:MAG: hypothetical protein AAB337_03705 [Patescibacteria group bacterium]
MKPQFQRILDLVKRTGDRMIVTDADGSSAYVIMGLDQYEYLLDHSEARLSDFSDSAYDKASAGMDFDQNHLVGDLTPDDGDVGEEVLTQVNGVQEDEIPKDLKKAVEHDLAIIESWEKTRSQEEAQKSKKKVDTGIDEERFYLEPVE